MFLISSLLFISLFMSRSYLFPLFSCLHFELSNSSLLCFFLFAFWVLKLFSAVCLFSPSCHIHIYFHLFSPLHFVFLKFSLFVFYYLFLCLCSCPVYVAPSLGLLECHPRAGGERKGWQTAQVLGSHPLARHHASV